MNYRFSQYGLSAVSPAPVNQMMAAFARDFRDGVDINLGVGYVNEKTIPIAWLLEAMHEVSAHPAMYRQAFNYGGPHGSPNLIAALKRFYLRHNFGDITEDILNSKEIVIGSSGATSILEALADIFQPGIVITADPMYYIYCDYLERKGFRVVTVPEDGQGLSPEAVETRLNSLGDAIKNLAFFYVVTVNNPSGVILSNQRKRGLVEAVSRWSARAGHPTPIFFDQAYEWLIHDSKAEKPQSAMLMDREGLAYEIGTLSKVLAPALRIGFMLGSPGPLMDAVAQKTSDVGFSAPLTNQEMAAYMLETHISEQLERVKGGYREKAARIGMALREILGPWLEEMRGGRGGFYFYLTLRGIRTDRGSSFFQFLARKTGEPAIDGPPGHSLPRVMYIPGEFCVHPSGLMAEGGRYQLRLSYGYEDTENIIGALHLMREAAVYAEQHQ